MPWQHRISLISILTLCVCVGGCTCGSANNAADTQKSLQSSTQPTTVEPGSAQDTAQALDTVIADWLGDEHHREATTKCALLLGRNLPVGYQPKVSDWTVLRTEECNPQDPPETVRDGDVEYRLNIKSSYDHPKDTADIIYSGNTIKPAPPTRYVDINNPEVLLINSMHLDKDSGEIKISQNLHYNMGGSGTTYKLKRVNGRWVCHAGGIWMS